MYLGTLVLAAASGLSLTFFIKRVWLFIPIFTGLVVLPATFNFITPGHIVVPFGTWFGYRVGMTSQGLTSAGLIVTRVATSISLVVLLTLTTPWNRLLAALRALSVPRMFILVLAWRTDMCSTCSNSVTDMYTARKARMVGATGDVTSGRTFVAASAGALFGKSHALAEEVHMAMVARGYTRQPAHPRHRPGATPATSALGDRVPWSSPSSSWEAIVPSASDDRARRCDDVSYPISNGSPPSTVSPHGAPRREGRRCSAPTAAASRRCSKSSTGSSSPTPARTALSAQTVTEDNLEDEQFNHGFRTRLGFIFQNSDAQVFSPSVRDEIAFGPLNMGLAARAGRGSGSSDTLAMLDIDELADRAPYQLSGGQKKRVAIASVLVMNPEVLLFDEPTAALDPRTQQWLIELIVELNRAGKTIVLATHDLDTLDRARRSLRRVLRGPPHRRRRTRRRTSSPTASCCSTSTSSTNTPICTAISPTPTNTGSITTAKRSTPPGLSASRATRRRSSAERPARSGLHEPFDGGHGLGDHCLGVRPAKRSARNGARARRAVRWRRSAAPWSRRSLG